jgi:hypothetical protein
MFGRVSTTFAQIVRPTAAAVRTTPVIIPIRTIVSRPPYNPDRECSTDYYDCPDDGPCDCRYAAEAEDRKMREWRERVEMENRCILEICENAQRNEDLRESMRRERAAVGRRASPNIPYYMTDSASCYYRECVCIEGKTCTITGVCFCNPFNYAD